MREFSWPVTTIGAIRVSRMLRDGRVGGEAEGEHHRAGDRRDRRGSGAASDASGAVRRSTLLRASRPDTFVQRNQRDGQRRPISGTTIGASSVSAITSSIGVNIASGTTASPVPGRISASSTIEPARTSTPKTTRTGPIRGGSSAASRRASTAPTRPARRAADRAPSIATTSPIAIAIASGDPRAGGLELHRRQFRVRRLAPAGAASRAEPVAAPGEGRRERDDQRLAEHHPA